MMADSLAPLSVRLARGQFRLGPPRQSRVELTAVTARRLELSHWHGAVPSHGHGHGPSPSPRRRPGPGSHVRPAGRPAICRVAAVELTAATIRRLKLSRRAASRTVRSESPRVRRAASGRLGSDRRRPAGGEFAEPPLRLARGGRRGAGRNGGGGRAGCQAARRRGA
jgi:hypothetical protein